ncbi:MAG: formate dehydrogenase accessory sulfurtransferase FdhD [Thermodesulfovibrionales bacterium]|jgi:FdhD protein
MEPYKTVPVLKIKEKLSSVTDDLIAVEKKLRISVNGKNVISLYCTPLMVRELVTGIIHDEGIISGEWCADRMAIEYDDEIRVDVPSSGNLHEGEKTITSGCAGGVSFGREAAGIVTDNVSFAAETIKTMFREFQQKSDAYRLTGGVHSAALTDGNKILVFAEDIGRHNAVDKVIGYCLLENLPFKGMIMLASGRLSSEIVSKCARCAIPVLVSRSAPTSLAIKIGESSGITVIGFVRGDRMNVYTGRQRILLSH